MREYAIMSGSNVICIVEARNVKAAMKKAVARLASEYKRKNNIKILRFAYRQKNN